MASSGSSTDQGKAKGPPPKGPPARKAPPAALLRQMGHATNRIDDASSTCSWTSWTKVDDDSAQPPYLPRVNEEGLGEQGDTRSGFGPSPPPGWSTQPVYSFPPPPPAKASSAAANASVLQAAQGLLDHSNKNPTSRRLRRQEQAARRGRGECVGANWPLGALLTTRSIPPFLITFLRSGQAKVRDPSSCWTIVTEGCRALFRAGFSTRCSPMRWQGPMSARTGMQFARHLQATT